MRSILMFLVLFVAMALNAADVTVDGISYDYSSESTLTVVRGSYSGDVVIPDEVVINAGTNDVAENQGPYSEDFALGNIISMTELARANGIAIVLTSVLPAAAFRWRPAITDAADKIAALNVRIKAYAKEQGIPYVDYYTPMVVSDPSRALNPAYSKDGVHPIVAGYQVMEPLVAEAITEALNSRRNAEDTCDCDCCRK